MLHLKALYSLRFLGILLLADITLLIIHGVRGIFYPTNTFFSIYAEMGLAELFQYFKEFSIFFLLIIHAIKKRRSIFFFWALLFVYLLLDDSLEIHETLGNRIAVLFNFPTLINLGPQHIGEVFVSGIVGLIFLVLIGLSYKYAKPIDKRVSFQLVLLIFLLAIFGVFVDSVHAAVNWGGSIWGILEDGGEMITMSLIVAYVFDMPKSIELVDNLIHKLNCLIPRIFRK
ncbi:hypothetical protein [Robiginitalea sp. SC105]|uniref:hypothetical protein n=1 Tax=Robiginitalea sp. SC105 TaxID=2762332 RepID=UPI001639E5D8|nr:hypothetical protein [Robiginitalea sp. SC105]MBC2837987.1 hypothetical protein [Robiginitalea sp. SC105]